MKALIQIFILTLVLASCKTKKEIPVAQNIEKKNVPEAFDKQPEPSPDLNKRPRDERMRRPTIDPEQIVAQLGMDENQENKFLAYWEKNQAEMAAIRKSSEGDRSGMREKMMEIRQKGQTELEAILSPEQLSQYKQILAKDRMKQRRGQ